VRREEQHHNAELKNTRYVWLKNPNNLLLAEKEKLGTLKDMNLMTSKAYNFKLSLKDFWTYNENMLNPLNLISKIDQKIYLVNLSIY
jgi:transposase